MSSSNFDESLDGLEKCGDDPKLLLKVLIDIRKDVDWPRHKDRIVKLRERGCLKQIISALNTSKKSILDVSLSILGNCCLDSICAATAIAQFSILPALNQVLKRFPKEDSINGRVFRIVGNLCQHRDQWANLILEKKPKIVTHIVKFLKDDANNDNEEESTANKASEATLVMGIRALRELLNRMTLKDLVKTHEALKAVGMLLIKYSPEWENGKHKEAIIMNIIKLLLEYSSYRYYPSIMELRTTDKGDSIIHLSKIVMIAPKQVVKIVMNFLRISQLKSDLPIPEIFNSLIKLLSNSAVVGEFASTYEECIKCICHLLEHPGNRTNSLCGESFPILVNILDKLPWDSNSKIECSLLIVSTLNRCRYDDSLMLDQIRCNTIGVATQKLIKIVGTLDPLAIVHKSEIKRKPKSSFTSRECKKRSREMFQISSSSSDNDEEFLPNLRMERRSPSSSDSDMAVSWTSGLSPRSGPLSHNNFTLSESDSDDYSPVCSEIDVTDGSRVDPEDEQNPITDPDGSELLNEERPIAGGDGEIKGIRVKFLFEIIRLLKSYTLLKPPATQLSSRDLLLALIKASCYFEGVHSWIVLDIVDVIHRIVDVHEHLIALMRTDFVHVVYGLRDLQHGSWCAKCHQFQTIHSIVMKRVMNVAESGAGKGDIAHQLLRGDNLAKQQLVLAIPYVIKTKAILMKLMLNCGGLEVLMKMLRDQPELSARSIKVLCVLASEKLSIPNPKSVLGVFSKQFSQKGVNTSEEVSNPPQLVTFKFDDGKVLKADREMLSRTSDFFSGMLDGHFKESAEDVISLHNVVYKSFKWLMRIIECEVVGSAPLDLIDVDLDTHLDIIALCDRFLMPDYCVNLTGIVEKCRLTSKTVPVIYQWSMDSRTNLLRVECVAYALVGNIVDSDRINMFQHLFQLGYTEELVEDIRKLLLRYLTISPSFDHFKDRRNKKPKYISSFINDWSL